MAVPEKGYWSPWSKNFALSLTEEEVVMLATSHMDKLMSLRKEDGVRMTFQIIIQGRAVAKIIFLQSWEIYQSIEVYNI